MEVVNIYTYVAVGGHLKMNKFLYKDVNLPGFGGKKVMTHSHMYT